MPSKVKHRLPIRQLFVLAVARLSEPIAMTSIFPYLPEMISFFVSPEDVSKWAGIVASCFNISVCLTGILWSRLSNSWGRKRVILMGLTNTMLMTCAFGFSNSIIMLIVVRSLMGAGNGNVGVIRTMTAEMVPWKEYQARVFSLMPLVWNFGSIFGPIIGGVLANPFNVKPGDQPTPHAGFFRTLLEKYPFLLPNLFSVAIFTFGIVLGLLFLDETLSTKKYSHDSFREIGRPIENWADRQGARLSSLISKIFQRIRALWQKNEHGETEDHERDPLLKGNEPANGNGLHNDEESHTRRYTGSQDVQQAAPIVQPSIRECLTRLPVLNLTAYGFLALHNIAYDLVMPVFLYYHEQKPDDYYNPPFRFAGGFGLKTRDIGWFMTATGIFGTAVQALLYAPTVERFGVLRAFRACSIGFPIFYLMTPFTVLIPDKSLRHLAILLVLTGRTLCTIFAYPSSTILICRAAANDQILGVLNGLATSVGAGGRALGPAIGGPLFTFAVEHSVLPLPWFAFAFLASIVAVLSFWIEDPTETDEKLEQETTTESNDTASRRPEDAQSIEQTPDRLEAESQEDSEDGTMPALPLLRVDTAGLGEPFDAVGSVSSRRSSTLPLLRSFSHAITDESSDFESDDDVDGHHRRSSMPTLSRRRESSNSAFRTVIRGPRQQH